MMTRKPIMTHSPSLSLSDLTDALLTAARRAGADEADAIALHGTSVSIDVRDGALEQAERADGVQIGLRVILNGRQACVSASDQTSRTISEMAVRAVAMAKEAPVDDTVGLARPDQLCQTRDLAALELADPGAAPDPADLQNSALRMESAARAVPGVTQVQSASAAFGETEVWIAASNGFSGGYRRTSHGLSAVAISGAGLTMERDWAGEGRVWAEDLPAPETIGQQAGTRAVSRAGARKPPTGGFAVLYDERVASSVIGHLIQAVNGAAVARGASWLRDALGEAVLPEALSLIEEPHRPRMAASRLFDAEGLATQRRTIVDRGVLTGWTLDLASGRKLGMESTANAARGLTSPPSPSVTNLTLTPGGATREDLIRDMGRGLIVTSFLGASINATTGDYSRGAAGFWVENGDIAYPVNECTIAGNLRDMLRRLIPANDARAFAGHRVPSLLVEGMTIAGS